MRAKLPVQLDNPFQRVRFLCLSVCWDSNGKQAKTITTKHVQVLTKPTRQTWNLACRFSKHGLRFRSKVDWELFIAHSQCLVKKNNNYLSDYYHSNSTLHFQPIPRNLSLSLSLSVWWALFRLCVFGSLVFKFKVFQTNKSRSQLFWYRACLWPYKKRRNEDEGKRKVLQIKEHIVYK